jgi:hypothetical protein
VALYGGSIYQNSGGSFTTLWPLMDLKCGTVASLALLELSVLSGNDLSQTIFALGRSSSELIQKAPDRLVPYDPSDPATTTSIAQQWTVLPSTPTFAFRRHLLNTSSGLGFIWSFPRGLRLIAPYSLILYAPAIDHLMGHYHISVEVDE